MGTVSDAQAKAAANNDPAESEGEGAPTDTAPETRPNLYCLDASHAGQLVTVDRFFRYDPPEGEENAAPLCTVCTDANGKPKRVSAAALEYDDSGEPVIPANLVALGERIQ